MKKVLLPLLAVLTFSGSALFAAETKEAAKDKSCCESESSCCNDPAQKKDAKDTKAPVEKAAEPKKS